MMFELLRLSERWCGLPAKIGKIAFFLVAQSAMPWVIQAATKEERIPVAA